MAENISVVFSIKDEFSNNVDGIINNTRKAQDAMKDAAGSAESLGNSGQSGFGKIASGAASIAGAIGLTKALSGAFNLVKDSIGSATARIDTMEQFERTMGAITGSTEASEKAMGDLREGVTGTAYGLDVAAKATQDFVTRGMDIDDATKRVEAWGDAVAFYGDGSNEQYARVNDAIAKMTSTGKVGGQELRTLYDAGINAPQMYADVTGKSVEEVQKALTDGSISTEEFLEVVEDGMINGAGGVHQIAGAAKEAGASWGASFDNMKAAVSRGVVSIVEDIDEMLENNGLPDMREMVAGFGKKFEGVLKGLGEKIPIIAEKVMGVYETIKPGLDWMADEIFPRIADAMGTVVEKATDVYNFFADHWDLIGPIITGVAGALALLKTGMLIYEGVQIGVNIVVGLWNAIMAVNPAVWVAVAIGALVGVAISLYKNWDIVKEKTSQLWDKFKETKAFEVLEKGLDAIKSGLESVGNFFGSVKDKFLDFKNAITNFTPPKWISTIGGGISSAASAVGNFVTGGSYATGTDNVPHDMVADIHKGEMIIPARQSENLRKQGVGIHNIDRQPKTVTKTNNVQRSTGNITIAKLADEIVIREEADIDKFATMFVNKLKSAQLNMA